MNRKKIRYYLLSYGYHKEKGNEDICKDIENRISKIREPFRNVCELYFLQGKTTVEIEMLTQMSAGSISKYLNEGVYIMLYEQV